MPEDFPPVVVEVWPDNWTSVQVFGALSTQWNVGPGGVIGLRYEAMPMVRDCFGISNDDWPEIFHDIRVMESAAVDLLRHKDG